MAEIFDELEISSSRVDPGHYPRPMISSLDTWDQSTQVDYHNSVPAGRRPGWNIPSIAVTSETVNTVRSSAPTRFISPAVPVHKVPMLLNKTTNAQAWKPMPNMAQTIRSDSDVQISFSASVSATPTTHSPFFAIFRDGRQISQVYRSSGTSIFLISGAYVDTAAPKGLHVYDLRWKVDPTVTGGTITAVQINRTFQASNLRAQ